MLELTVRIEVPEPPTIVVALRVAARPVDGLAVRATVPLNPSNDEIVIVEVVDSVASTADGAEALIVKSCTLYVTVAVCEAKPVLDAVRVTVYTPAGPEQERIDVAVLPAGGVTLAGVKKQTSGDGYEVAVKLTAWLKLPDEVTVTVESPADPA